jgi:exodeoxyribonuclease V beta subunit
MDEFNIDSLDYCINLAKSRYSNYLELNDFEKIKNSIFNLLQNTTFQELIKDSEFISEQSIIYKEEIKIIDLLLYKNDSYYILDYKTTKEKHLEHKVQVNHYKKAISDIFNTSNVYSYLVYMNDESVSIDEVK